jgi:hypothetical protein
MGIDSMNRLKRVETINEDVGKNLIDDDDGFYLLLI